jgi:hypothetical protein
MLRNRRAASVVQSSIDIKRWQQHPPSVAEARPSRCPACGAASCPVGGRISLHGHGTRERQVRGPLEPDRPPVLLVVPARRYHCVPCGAVLIVVPRELRGRRVYSASAMGFALALWGLARASAAEVRRRVSPATILGHTAVAGWVTLRRWARDVAHGRLFSSVPFPGPSLALRGVAQRAAAALAASADATTRALAIEHRAFLGAAQAA